MTKPKIIKGFDCVKMKHDSQEKIHRATKGMNSAQRRQDMHDQVSRGPLGDLWRRLGKKTAQTV